MVISFNAVGLRQKMPSTSGPYPLRELFVWSWAIPMLALNYY